MIYTAMCNKLVAYPIPKMLGMLPHTYLLANQSSHQSVCVCNWGMSLALQKIWHISRTGHVFCLKNTLLAWEVKSDLLIRLKCWLCHLGASSPGVTTLWITALSNFVCACTTNAAKPPCLTIGKTPSLSTISTSNKARNGFSFLGLTFNPANMCWNIHI